ncbi:MAG: hypothetical protein EOP85_05755 [Verrucomicrobiaceae bacterium]|nr:MAG: hypothetical protein EOP85_05755 [Verrucomicrobiaceae bacterium]
MKRISGFPVPQRLTVPLLLAAGIVVFYLLRPDADGGGETDDNGSGSESIRFRTGERTAGGEAEKERRKQAISEAADRWHEELLEIYPDMRPEFRDVADADNGFLQFLLLAESKEMTELPKEIEVMFWEEAPWDAGKFAAWQAEHREGLVKLLKIAELPDRSTKGIDFGRFAKGARLTPTFGNVLAGSALLAFEQGDEAAALRYSRAAIRLSNHLTGVEAPSVLGKVIAQGYDCRIRDMFRDSILPSLSDDASSLQAWREAIFPPRDAAADYRLLLKGEWNCFIRSQILPALLGEHSSEPEAPSFDIADNNAYFQHYTQAVRDLAAGFSNSGPGRLDLAQSELQFPSSVIAAQTLLMLNETSASYRGIFSSLGKRVTEDALISAAIAIRLGESPGVDPVSGQPFLWDATTRTLKTPPESRDPLSLTLK